MSNFHPLQVVGRGSDPQLQVGEKLKLYNLTLQGLNLWFFNWSLIFFINFKLDLLAQLPAANGRKYGILNYTIHYFSHIFFQMTSEKSFHLFKLLGLAVIIILHYSDLDLRYTDQWEMLHLG